MEKKITKDKIQEAASSYNATMDEKKEKDSFTYYNYIINFFVPFI